MNTSGNTSVNRIGLLWRGDRDAEHRSDRVDTMVGPLFGGFAELGVSAEHVVYADDAVDEVRAQLLCLDGVLVWVNPIQGGTNRAQLDALLREVSAQGVWVSAHPEVTGARHGWGRRVASRVDGDIH